MMYRRFIIRPLERFAKGDEFDNLKRKVWCGFQS
jgi:hypothetical protein